MSKGTVYHENLLEGPFVTILEFVQKDRLLWKDRLLTFWNLSKGTVYKEGPLFGTLEQEITRHRAAAMQC